MKRLAIDEKRLSGLGAIAWSETWRISDFSQKTTSQIILMNLFDEEKFQHAAKSRISRAAREFKKDTEETANRKVKCVYIQLFFPLKIL